MRVTFVHPDLGIGGAERLVLDAAIAMHINGHDVCIVTNHYSGEHCFEDSKQFEIRTVDVFPRSIFGFATALCAYIRMCIAALYVCAYIKTDLVFCDSISACMVIFRVFRLFNIFTAPIFFYCHFPDLMLTQRKTLMKRIYRYVIDSVESWTTGMADLICVNSHFTKGVVLETFPYLADRRLHVLYPTLNTKFFDESPAVALEGVPDTAKYVFLSINRYERKKNLKLAIDAFAELKNLLSEEEFRKCFLVIAGGFDRCNEENLLYHRELKEYAVELQISTKQLLFMRSPSDEVKVQLLRRATAVLYTPSGEHFGIVPVEAMYMERCVIAVDSGGPKESIVDGDCGFLVDADALAFARKMAAIVNGEVDVRKFGAAGRQRVVDIFTMDSFAKRLEVLVQSLFR